MPDKVAGFRDVPLVGDPEAKELPLKGVEGDLDPCLLLRCVSWSHLSGWNARSRLDPEPARQKGELLDLLVYRFVAPPLDELNNP